MPAETHPPSAEHLLHLKAELIERWQQLPVEHQASLAIVLLDSVLQSDYALWIVEAMAFRLEQAAKTWSDDHPAVPIS